MDGDTAIWLLNERCHSPLAPFGCVPTQPSIQIGAHHRHHPKRISRSLSPFWEDARFASCPDDAAMEHDEVDGATASQPPVSGSPSAPRAISRGRLLLVNTLIALTTVVLLVGILAIWANRLLFSPENWSNASTQLLQNPNVRSATANYLVDQLYANVNVPGLIRSGLPPQLQGLAAPAAGALRNAAVQGAELALMRPRVQNLWAQANRAADETFIAIVEGGTGPVKVNGGAVTLNLSAILDDVATRLGLPSNLGAKLPPSVATLTVFRSSQLSFVQNVGNAVRHLALWLTILVPVLYALALLLATGHRRRTLMTIGFAGAFAGVLGLVSRTILETQISNSLTNDPSLRSVIRATIGIGTYLLSQVSGACIVIGVALMGAAWLAGPAGAACWGRRALTPFLREHPGESFAVALMVMILVFIWNPIPATGKPAGMIVFTLLALLGTEVLRRQAIAEFPDARAGDATQAARARVQSLRRPQPANGTAPAASSSMAQQLEQLADLCDHGAITPDEYQAAKSKLFQS